jgi:hypothetical protein
MGCSVDSLDSAAVCVRHLNAAERTSPHLPALAVAWLYVWAHTAPAPLMCVQEGDKLKGLSAVSAWFGGYVRLEGKNGTKLCTRSLTTQYRPFKVCTAAVHSSVLYCHCHCTATVLYRTALCCAVLCCAIPLSCRLAEKQRPGHGCSCAVLCCTVLC